MRKSFKRIIREHKPAAKFWPARLFWLAWIVNIFRKHPIYTRCGAALFDIAMDRIGDKMQASILELTADLIEFGSKRTGERILCQVAHRRQVSRLELRMQYKSTVRGGGGNGELIALVKQVRTGFAL